MTTTATHTHVGPLTASGTANLPFNFQAISTGEVGVFRDGEELIGGYTVFLYPDGTGYVTPSSSWGSSQIVIFSKPYFTQQTQFDRFEPFYPDGLNHPFDILGRQILALRDFLIDRWYGDHGDISVDIDNNWTINNDVVTFAKMQNVASGTVFYRRSSGTGNPEVWPLATLKADLNLTTLISDAAYGPSWDGVASVAPSQNAVFDVIESLVDLIGSGGGGGGGGGTVSDAAYGPLWDGVTTVAPSQNALYDKIQTIASSPSPLGDSELSQILTGLQVVWTGGLNFSMSAGSYYIDGEYYTANEQVITLDAADPTHPRIDVLAIDNTGTLVKVTGAPAASPSEPDVDPVTQLKLIFVTVAAGAAAPGIAADEVIYAEGSEWPYSTNGIEFVVNSTSEPDTGTYCIAGTDVAGGGPNGVVVFNKGTPILRSDFIMLSLRVKSKTSNWGTGRLRIMFYNAAGSRVGNVLSIRRNNYGFKETNTSSYQQVAIALSSFSIPANTQIQYFIITGSGGSFDCRIDNIKLSRASTATGATGGGLTVVSADARYLQRANNLADVNDPAIARNNIDAAPSLLTIETVAGTTYALDAADPWRHLRFTNAAGIALTVPANATTAIAVGSRIRVTQAGAGVITLAPAVGVTLNSRNSALSSAGTYAVFELEKVATDEWDILGDVA